MFINPRSHTSLLCGVITEVTRLDSALKDYSHYSECPIKKQVVLINLDGKKTDTRLRKA